MPAEQEGGPETLEICEYRQELLQMIRLLLCPKTRWRSWH